MANLRTSVFAPITLPTWDRISQMSKHIYNSMVAWGFLKAYHKDAYKQLLLLDQGYVNLTLFPLISPASGLWYAFVPRVLLFGAPSSAIHYN